MTVEVKTSVVGIRDAVLTLNKLEPGLRKQFAKELNQIAAPALDAAKSRYASLGMPLSGMAKPWTDRGRARFPYSPAKAAKGVEVKLDTRRNATAVIVIQQKDPAASIFETAGRKNANNLATQLGATPLPGRTRLFGLAVYSKIRQVSTEIERAAIRVANDVGRKLS